MATPQELTRTPAPFEVVRAVEGLCAEALPALEAHIRSQLRALAKRAVVGLVVSQVPMAAFFAVGAWGNGTLRSFMFFYWAGVVGCALYLGVQEHLPYHQHHRKLQRQFGELLVEAQDLRTSRPFEISEQDAQALWSRYVILRSDIRGA